MQTKANGATNVREELTRLIVQMNEEQLMMLSMVVAMVKDGYSDDKIMLALIGGDAA